MFSSKTGWLSIATAVVWFLGNITPVIPQPWGNLVTAILGILAFYHIGGAVAAARSLGAKGL